MLSEHVWMSPTSQAQARNHDGEKRTHVRMIARTQLGFQHKPRSLLEELRGERGREILLELENLDVP
jgi:hypothetical protein